MAAYLTPAQAATRLAAYGITHTPAAGDVIVASNELDASGGPFIGAKLDSTQERAFPRDRDPRGNTIAAGSTPPDEVLDAVALLSYLASAAEVGAIKSYSVLDKSVTYETAQASPHVRRIASLLAPYQRKVGTRAGSRAYPERELFER